MKRCICSVFLMLSFSSSGWALEVNIAEGLPSIDVQHQDRVITIMRNQNESNVVSPDYAKTSRKCPPFCIQPIKLATGVDTIGELEVLDYLKRRAAGDQSILVIDSRTPDWVMRGTIPGSVNVPWTTLSVSSGADPFEITAILEDQFGALSRDGLWDFSAAKTLVLFCNGMWCGQSPMNIRSLLALGYPSEKLKWYRGGMQDWEILGLTTIRPEN